MAEVVEASAPLELVAEGDAAWWAGERGRAARAWRASLEAADATAEGRAAEVMARVRLLKVSGNLGPFVHEPPLNRALADCPMDVPACRLALADWHLYMPGFVGADPRRVPDVLEGMTGPEADARRAWAASGERPEDPGTWVLTFGVAGAPGAGVGVSAGFTHPDLAARDHDLSVTAALDSLGGGSFAAAFQGAGEWSPQVGGGVGRTAGWRWVDDAPVAYDLDVARVSVGVGRRAPGRTLQVGVTSRWEQPGDGLRWAPGPWLVAGVGDGGARARVTLETGFVAYRHLGVGVDLRAFPRVGRATVALHAVGAAAPTDETPWWRLPSAGGSTLLRGAPAGRWRDDTLLAAQVELRHPLVGPLEGALFADGARVEGWHVSGGGGLRIVLPPERLNVTRVDVGVSEVGWGVVVGFGEAF